MVEGRRNDPTAPPPNNTVLHAEIALDNSWRTALTIPKTLLPNALNPLETKLPRDLNGRSANLNAALIPDPSALTPLSKVGNPFLRTSVDQVKENAESYANKQNLQPVEVLAAIRDWKDNF